MTTVYLFEVDWDDDGFGDAIDDITADVISYPLADSGRNYNSQIYGKAIAGKFTAILRNDDDKYNRFNSASTLFGKVLPGHRVRWRIYSPMTTNVLTGTGVTAALDAADFPAGDQAIDAGKTTIGRWWSNRQLVHNAIRDVEETEGGPFRETNDAKLAFEARNQLHASTHQPTVAEGQSNTDGLADGVSGRSVLVEGFTPPAEVIADVKRIVAAANIEVGGVEYLVNQRDGQVYYYDINALSNFVANAPQVVGFDPFPRLVDYLLVRAGLTDLVGV